MAPHWNHSPPCCAHCGLPVPASPLSPTTTPGPSGAIYCCHACRLVAAIVGPQHEGEHSWNLLRLGFGALLAMNVMMISLLLYFGSVEPGSIRLFRLILLALSSLSLAVLLPPFLAGAARDLAEKRLSLDALIACGALSAFLVSAVNAIGGAGEVYFDTATMLPVLVTFGKLLDASTKRHASDLLRSLEALLPASALREGPAGVAELGIDQLQPGDLIRIRPGERIAVDGCILEGCSSIEEAPFTGEFLPRLCGPGDRVIAGTVNGTGALLVQAEKTGSHLLLHGILALVRDAWRSPSTCQRFAEKAATLFTPAVLALAAGAFSAWAMAGDPRQGLLSALSVLVVACPCTIGIATPLATSLALARAAREGVVVRGGSVMERMAGTRKVFFDKTGTITTGSPEVLEIQVTDPLLDRSELLGVLATLEAGSEHPLARAVVSKAASLGLEQGFAARIRTVPGKGVSGLVTWKGRTREIAAGIPSFVGLQPAPHPLPDRCTVVEIAWEGKLRGRLLLTDAVRADAPGCIARLKEQGVETVLLSGDRLAVAESVASMVGIDRVSAPRDPGEKLSEVSAAIDAGETVAMVGDGVNDAPSLAAAQTGIALGAGMDLAKQAGNVVILSGRLAQIPWLFSLSRRTVSTIRGNLAWSFGYNTIALAAAVTGMLHPLLAACAMVISSVTVLGNSLRLSSFPECEPAAQTHAVEMNQPELAEATMKS